MSVVEKGAGTAAGKGFGALDSETFATIQSAAADGTPPLVFDAPNTIGARTGLSTLSSAGVGYTGVAVNL